MRNQQKHKQQQVPIIGHPRLAPTKQDGIPLQRAQHFTMPIKAQIHEAIRKAQTDLMDNQDTMTTTTTRKVVIPTCHNHNNMVTTPDTKIDHKKEDMTEMLQNRTDTKIDQTHTIEKSMKTDHTRMTATNMIQEPDHNQMTNTGIIPGIGIEKIIENPTINLARTETDRILDNDKKMIKDTQSMF